MSSTKIKSTPKKTQSQMPAFLRNDGKMADLIDDFDWSRTSLGPIKDWPQSLRTSVNIALQSPVPIVLLWGNDGIMIYNDAYSEFAGARHPGLLGSKVVEGWPEVADFNRHVMREGLKGKTLSYKDQQLTLYRNNKPEEVWMNLNYSPVMDEGGKPAGVMAIVVETTERVLAEQRQKQAESQLKTEKDRLQAIFMQAPAFITLLEGPDHVYILANKFHEELVGKGREIIGKTVREALGELTDQGIYELLDRVYTTGEPFVGTEMPVQLARGKDGELDIRYLNFVYQPYRDANDNVQGIFVHGVDVTEQVRSRQRIEDHSAVLELITGKASLSEVLDVLAANVEKQAGNGVKASILLLDEDGEHLHHGAAPSLPQAYITAIDGLEIGPHAGSCGTAAYRNRLTVTPDIATDPLWKDYKDVALEHGLRACWSTPICSGNKVLGTFAMYYTVPYVPTKEDQQIMEFAARTASIAIEQKYAEVAIKESEEKYRSLFTCMDQGFCIIEVIFNRKRKAIDYRFMESNPTFTQHSGLHQPEGKTARELVPGLEEKWFEFYGNIALTGKSGRMVDGSNVMDRWFDVYAFPFGNPKNHRVAVLFTDITERRKVEERNLYLATITQNIADAVIATDNDYVITNWNEGAEIMYGWTAEEAIGKSAPKLIRTEFAKQSTGRPWFEALTERGKWQGEVIQRHKSGRPIYVMASVTHLKDSEGNIVGNLAINRDISEEKQAQEEQQKLMIMTEQRNALIKVNKTKDEFIALASHQLRTPATAVKQYIGLLLNEFVGTLTADQLQYLQIAYDSNERELGIINDLLKTAQIDSNKYQLKKQSHNIVEIIREAIDDLRPAFEQRKQTVAFHSSQTDISVMVDSTEIKLVFMNLLENASKYSYPGTEIKVVVEQKDQHVKISVTDKGVGVSKDNQQRIFDKFTRVNNDLSDTVTGTGLGLYWVRQIVELHKGSVKLTSALGKGSTFTVRLPHE